MAQEFTAPERKAIDAAYRALAYLCDCTDWSDAPALREALKLERAQTGNATAAKAMVCKAWAEGLDNPDKPASAFYWIRPGYLRAFLMGVGHKVRRADDSYTGPMVAEARELCVAAIAANDAHTARIVEA